MLTEIQNETLNFIEQFIKKNGRHPTYKEIQKEFNLKSTSSAFQRVKKMRKNIFKCPFCGIYKNAGQREIYKL